MAFQNFTYLWMILSMIIFAGIVKQNYADQRRLEIAETSIKAVNATVGTLADEISLMKS